MIKLCRTIVPHGLDINCDVKAFLSELVPCFFISLLWCHGTAIVGGAWYRFIYISQHIFVNYFEFMNMNQVQSDNIAISCYHTTVLFFFLDNLSKGYLIVC